MLEWFGCYYRPSNWPPLPRNTHKSVPLQCVYWLFIDSGLHLFSPPQYLWVVSHHAAITCIEWQHISFSRPHIVIQKLIIFMILQIWWQEVHPYTNHLWTILTKMLILNCPWWPVMIVIWMELCTTSTVCTVHWWVTYMFKTSHLEFNSLCTSVCIITFVAGLQWSGTSQIQVNPSKHAPSLMKTLWKSFLL